MSVGPAIGFLGFPKWTTSYSICTREDTDLPPFRPMTSGLHHLRNEGMIAPPYPELWIKSLDLEMQTAP